MTRSNKTNDDWLFDLSNKLDKQAVQPMRDSLFNQINTIMNGGQSKFSTVDEVVEDMKSRSGFSSMISKISDDISIETNKKVANSYLEKYPQILNTICNLITSSKGHLPIPAIIEKVKALHSNDVDNNFFDDERLISFVTKKNLEEKSNHFVDENFNNLGKKDYTCDDDNQPWNKDPFYGINA